MYLAMFFLVTKLNYECYVVPVIQPQSLACSMATHSIVEKSVIRLDVAYSIFT